MAQQHLIPLGEGVYTVSQVCRILQPGMTPRKVHWWLDTSLLGEPLRWGGPGRPTLLSFRQLLQIRTVQYLRDELEFSLPKVRNAFAWILENLFSDMERGLRFDRVGNELVVVTEGGDSMSVPGGQGIIPIFLTEHTAATRIAWERRAYVIPGKPQVVANARVQAGSPTITGTRIETALVASFSSDGQYTADDVAEVCRTYKALTPDAVKQAMEFEGIRQAS